MSTVATRFEDLAKELAAAHIKIEKLEQQLETERQKRQGARDAAEVAMQAASRSEALNAELIRQHGRERQSWQEAETAVAIVAIALDWYAMADSEIADEAMDKVEKLLSPEVFARIFRQKSVC